MNISRKCDLITFVCECRQNMLKEYYMQRPSKIENVLEIVRLTETAGKYSFAGHALKRLNEREVTVAEVRMILRNGFREIRKDEFREDFCEWNYALCGSTVDNRRLRVSVAIKKNGIIVITVIDLNF